MVNSFYLLINKIKLKYDEGFSFRDTALDMEINKRDRHALKM